MVRFEGGRGGERCGESGTRLVRDAQHPAVRAKSVGKGPSRCIIYALVVEDVVESFGGRLWEGGQERKRRGGGGGGGQSKFLATSRDVTIPVQYGGSLSRHLSHELSICLKKNQTLVRVQGIVMLSRLPRQHAHVMCNDMF